jgi:hypothetical protein
VFFFTLNSKKKTDLNSVWFFVLGWFWWFFLSFNVIDNFIIIFKVFLVENRLKNKFFGFKKVKAWFSSYYGGYNLGSIRQHVVWNIFFKTFCDGSHVVHPEWKKKGSIVQLVRVGPHTSSKEMGPTMLNPFFLSF